jgi:hypothetical protein
MIIDLNKKERDLLVTELEKSIIPERRGIVASGILKGHFGEDIDLVLVSRFA